MEWILVRRRLIALLLLLLAVAAASAIGILYATSVGHLNKKQLRHFAHEQRLYPRGYGGPIVERVAPE